MRSLPELYTQAPDDRRGGTGTDTPYTCGTNVGVAMACRVDATIGAGQGAVALYRAGEEQWRIAVIAADRKLNMLIGRDATCEGIAADERLIDCEKAANRSLTLFH